MKKILKKFLFGGRLLKTGISVFITAFICYAFHLPAIFAVITAIVTIEPTASDSIKKGLIRFPASVIGAAISMFIASILGETALSFALSTMFTIYVCHKLKLDAGILVATITGAVMIPTTEAHFLYAFITRIATTSIGIIVSTIVNIIILPPKFSPLIDANIKEIKKTASRVLLLFQEQLFNHNIKTQRKFELLYNKLTELIERANKLCYYQREEFKYHKQTANNIRTFHLAMKQLNILQLITFHLGNLKFIEYNNITFSKQEEDSIKGTIHSLVEILQHEHHHIPNKHFTMIENVNEIFHQQKDDDRGVSIPKYHHHFSPKTIILFELLSIHDALEDLEQLCNKGEKQSS